MASACGADSAPSAGTGPEYRFHDSGLAPSATFLAKNEAQSFSARFGTAVALEPSLGDATWHWRMTGVSLGRNDGVRPAAGAVNRVEGDRLVRRRANVTEWYRNGPDGLEQGFDLPTPPPGSGVLEVHINTEGLRPFLTGSGVELHDERGRPQLVYRKLYAEDASGRALPASMKVVGQQIRLLIDDSGAHYPVVIDPVVSTRVVELSASDGAASDEFGGTPFETSGGPTVAIDGDTALVAATFDDGDAGGVYVFTRSSTGAWSEDTKLPRPQGLGPEARFGYSLALDGNTAIVGAPLSGDGAAYVFVRGPEGWMQQEELTNRLGVAEDTQFGCAVAVSGDRALIGARYAGRGGNAQVFSRTDGNWTIEAVLTATDTAQGDDFGTVVAMDGDQAVVGSLFHPPGENRGAVYTFSRESGEWAQDTKLEASDRSPLDQFGRSLALSGSQLLVGAPQNEVDQFNQGTAYVFERAGEGWREQARLLSLDAAPGDHFGYSVAIDGSLAVIGARFDGSAEEDAGAVYVFEQSGQDWVEALELSAPDAAPGDRFGDSVALSQRTAVVGAPFTDDAAGNAGSAYIVDLQVTRGIGNPCAANAECASGFCVDSVCCNTSCGAGANDDCQACSTARGGSQDGECTALTDAVASLTVCRASADETCDVAETCVSGQIACPVDGFAPDNTSCGSTDICVGLQVCQSGQCQTNAPDPSCQTQPPAPGEGITGSGCACAAMGTHPKSGSTWGASLLVAFAALRVRRRPHRR